MIALQRWSHPANAWERRLIVEGRLEECTRNLFESFCGPSPIFVVISGSFFFFAIPACFTVNLSTFCDDTLLLSAFGCLLHT